MSITKILAFAVVLFSVSACATGPQYYNPATGARTAVVASGSCSPGDIQDGKSCICERVGGNYENCTLRTVAVRAVSSPTEWSYTQCLFQQVPTQACMAGALNGTSHYGYSNGTYGRTLYGPMGQCVPGQYCCPRPRYGETTHPLCGVMPQQPYRRP